MLLLLKLSPHSVTVHSVVEAAAQSINSLSIQTSIISRTCARDAAKHYPRSKKALLTGAEIRVMVTYVNLEHWTQSDKCVQVYFIKLFLLCVYELWIFKWDDKKRRPLLPYFKASTA